MYAAPIRRLGDLYRVPARTVLSPVAITDGVTALRV